MPFRYALSARRTRCLVERAALCRFSPFRPTSRLARLAGVLCTPPVSLHSMPNDGATFLALSKFLAMLKISYLISYLRISENCVNIYCTLHLSIPQSCMVIHKKSLNIIQLSLVSPGSNIRSCVYSIIILAKLAADRPEMTNRNLNGSERPLVACVLP